MSKLGIIKKDLVLLDKEVLDCIQHSSKSKIYVAYGLTDVAYSFLNLFQHSSLVSQL